MLAMFAGKTVPKIALKARNSKAQGEGARVAFDETLGYE
jgi:hypothetical protein